jgi:hypothetical protein
MPAVQPAPKTGAPKAQAKPATAKTSSKAVVNKAIVPRVSPVQLAALADKGVYINLELNQDLVDRRIAILSPESRKKLDGLKAFCSRFKKEAWTNSRREVELKAEVLLETPSKKTPILSPEQYRKLQSLKADFSKQYKRSTGTAEVG